MGGDNMKKFAVRNMRLCTKDCLCLFVCPTGATDTENSIIDVEKCIGCGACAESCTAGAICMVPQEYPAQQKKSDKVISSIDELAKSKIKASEIAKRIAKHTKNDGLNRLMSAVYKSSRLSAEDLYREGGYMLPQSSNSHKILKMLIDNPPTADFPVDVAKNLIDTIPCNDAQSKD